MEIKWYIPCEVCKKRKVFTLIKKREINIPAAGMATSKKKMCNTCYHVILEALTPKI
jgi:hypothetical protein